MAQQVQRREVEQTILLSFLAFAPGGYDFYLRRFWRPAGAVSVSTGTTKDSVNNTSSVSARFDNQYDG